MQRITELLRHAGEEPEVGLTLDYRFRVRALLVGLRARVSENGDFHEFIATCSNETQVIRLMAEKR
jgi:hypothetical protein